MPLIDQKNVFGKFSACFQNFSRFFKLRVLESIFGTLQNPPDQNSPSQILKLLIDGG